jgi:hypothetical protein
MRAHADQLDMFAAPPEVPALGRKWDVPADPGEFLPGQVRGTGVHASDERPYWKTRAWGHGGEILAYRDTPAPFELTIRGILTVVSFGMGFQTHAIDAPGSLYWSDTGFRSFTGHACQDQEEIRRVIEAHIDGPTKDHMGLGGKLTTWWPISVSSKVAEARWKLKQTADSYADLGEEKAAQIIAECRTEAARLLEEVRAKGIDPYAICPDLPRQSALL